MPPLSATGIRGDQRIASVRRGLQTNGHELRAHAEGGMREDVAMHGPSPDSATRRCEGVQRPVVEANSVDQTREPRNVHCVDELVEGKLSERCARRVVDEPNRLN